MVSSAFAWIGQIVEWFGQFFPRFQTLDMTQGAVKTEGFFLPRGLRRRLRMFADADVRVTRCGPGMHWWWPATTCWEVYPCSFQTDNLPSQTIETSDGTGVTLGGMISYAVSDVAALLTQCHSPVMAIRTVTLPAIHQVASRMTWDQLKEEQRKGTINTKLRNAVQKKLKEFGLDVESVELTDMTKVKALRLIQSTQNDMD
jgi:regulator of protease activity HflC (stomatin/prohibitin superfamily)